MATDTARVLNYFFIGRKIVFTNGFIKKTQVTPPAEIEKAKAYRHEFRAEYEALEPEFAMIQAMIDARKNTGLTL